MRMILSLAMGLVLSATAASATAGSLAREADINQGLFYVSVANKIRKGCDAIAPRTFTAIRYLEALKAEARARGYSEAEIDEYINDKDEKALMRERRDAYIRANGAEPEGGPGLCRLGSREIAEQSQIGKLLRAK
ncbi:hypothetical protein SAMN05443999_101289 [Roseovarius azorensis]|uniref:DUF5333 domain-containing protein n=1 Tax=Roseovarius azorensis TaxID=1287727 RepID=A0A1H7GES6_9RHOB|nr:DUF5333 domain-containing protein [Roseovarius azorensis]SEK36544.1 hypothetical protein SAMN05443999_101289 [Roseovarius azorensis]